MRRFVIGKSIVQAISANQIRRLDGTASVSNFFSDAYNSYQEATAGMLRFASTEIEKNGFNQYIPLTARSFLQTFIAAPDQYIDMYRKEKTSKFVDKLINLADPYTVNTWAMNLIPFYSSWSA